MIDLTPILQALIGLLATIITVKVIPWIKSKTTEQQQINLAAAANIAVYAAEQIFGAGQGEIKLQYVKDSLQRVGFDVDTDLLTECIEEAVYSMNHDTWTYGREPVEEPVKEPVEAPEADA
jgi:hypothetical protein